MHEFFKQQEYGEGLVEMRLKEWKLPIKTEDLETEELASMVKFESNSIIRFLTRDNRDILYKLDKNGSDVHYITEFKEV